MSRVNPMTERIDILTAENARLRNQLLAMTAKLAEAHKERDHYKDEVVRAAAEMVILNNRLAAKQMHLEAMLHPETAAVWHSRYLAEVLK